MSLSDAIVLEDLSWFDKKKKLKCLGQVTCYLLPSLYVAAFVRRTTSSTDLHPLLKRSLYFL
jgi:hypothetical protein